MKLALALWLIAVVAAMAFAASVVSAFADEEATVLVPVRMLAARLEECKNRGGCSFLTKAEMAEMYEAGRTAGKAEAFESLDFHGCRTDRS